MKKFWTSKQMSLAVLFFGLHFGHSTAVQAQAPSPVKEKRLVFLGDSLTEGYGVAHAEAFPTLIEVEIKKKKLPWKVVNAGVSGATSASAVQTATWQLKSKPDLIFLALGANDGLRGLKPEEMRKNLEGVLKLAADAKVPVVLAGMQMPPNYGADYTKKFAAVFPALAKQYQTHFMPFLLDGVAGDNKLNQADGIHPNKEGHKIMAKNVWKVLEPILEKK